MTPSWNRVQRMDVFRSGTNEPFALGLYDLLPDREVVREVPRPHRILPQVRKDREAVSYSITGSVGNGYFVGMTPLPEYTRADEIRAYAVQRGLTTGQAIVALVSSALDAAKEVG